MRRTTVCILSGLVFIAARAGAAEADGGSLNTIRDILETGGWPMDVLVGLSVFGTFLVLFFLFTLRKGNLFPKKLLREAQAAADEGDFEALEAICENQGSAAARIIHAAAEHVVSDPRAEYTVVRDALEDEGARQAGVLWQRIQYLLDVAVVAPMVGLLGTVLGMLQSFAALQTEVGVVKPTALAQGVSKALITTAGGLVVGISAMILYAIFRGRVNKLISGMESACNRILRTFMSSRSKNRY